MIVAEFKSRARRGVIEKEDGSLRIIDFVETHLLEFPHGQRASPVLCVSKIHPDHRDLAGTDFLPSVLAQNLLSQRHSHVRLSRFLSLPCFLRKSEIGQYPYLPL